MIKWILISETQTNLEPKKKNRFFYGLPWVQSFDMANFSLKYSFQNELHIFGLRERRSCNEGCLSACLSICLPVMSISQ